MQLFMEKILNILKQICNKNAKRMKIRYMCKFA